MIEFEKDGRIYVTTDPYEGEVLREQSWSEFRVCLVFDGMKYSCVMEIAVESDFELETMAVYDRAIYGDLTQVKAQRHFNELLSLLRKQSQAKIGGPLWH